jgi:hypothetical protein
MYRRHPGRTVIFGLLGLVLLLIAATGRSPVRFLIGFTCLWVTLLLLSRWLEGLTRQLIALLRTGPRGVGRALVAMYRRRRGRTIIFTALALCLLALIWFDEDPETPYFGAGVMWLIIFLLWLGIVRLIRLESFRRERAHASIPPPPPPRYSDPGIGNLLNVPANHQDPTIREILDGPPPFTPPTKDPWFRAHPLDSPPGFPLLFFSLVWTVLSVVFGLIARESTFEHAPDDFVDSAVRDERAMDRIAYAIGHFFGGAGGVAFLTALTLALLIQHRRIGGRLRSTAPMNGLIGVGAFAGLLLLGQVAAFVEYVVDAYADDPVYRQLATNDEVDGDPHKKNDLGYPALDEPKLMLGDPQSYLGNNYRIEGVVFATHRTGSGFFFFYGEQRERYYGLYLQVYQGAGITSDSAFVVGFRGTPAARLSTPAEVVIYGTFVDLVSFETVAGETVTQIMIEATEIAFLDEGEP